MEPSDKESQAMDTESAVFSWARSTAVFRKRPSRAEMLEQQKELDKQDVLQKISQMYLDMDREMPVELAQYRVGFLRAHLANIRRDARRQAGS